MPQIMPVFAPIPTELWEDPAKWGATREALDEVKFCNDCSGPNQGAMLSDRQYDLYAQGLQAIQNFHEGKKVENDDDPFFHKDYPRECAMPILRRGEIYIAPENNSIALRDAFAMRAMTMFPLDMGNADIARQSYELADFMLAERGYVKDKK